MDDKSNNNRSRFRGHLCRHLPPPDRSTALVRLPARRCMRTRPLGDYMSTYAAAEPAYKCRVQMNPTDFAPYVHVNACLLDVNPIKNYD